MYMYFPIKLLATKIEMDAKQKNKTLNQLLKFEKSLHFDIFVFCSGWQHCVLKKS